MILSTLIAASVAAQAAPAPEPSNAPAPAAEKKMACCEKMAKGEGCCCCKNMAEKGAAKDSENHAGHDNMGHAN